LKERAFQVGADELRVLETCFVEVSAHKMRVVEDCLVEVRAVEINTVQGQSGEIQVRQARVTQVDDHTVIMAAVAPTEHLQRGFDILTG
jgi:hypothetical protein